MREELVVSYYCYPDYINAAVIAPIFNRKDITVKFVEMLYCQSSSFKIYLSDSGSSDGTIEALEKHPGIQLIHAGNSAWWSAAVNRGIEKALEDGAEILLIMNDDIEFGEDLISELIAMHHHHPDNIITPVQKGDFDTFVGTLYQGWLRRVRHLATVPEDGLVETSNGCCLLVPKRVFSTVGLFDEKNCPHLYGDTEFQLRAGRAGFNTRVCAKAYIQQMSATDYFARLTISELFTFEASPLNWRAYKSFGATLFGGAWRFVIFGLSFHFDYVKVIVKTLGALARRAFTT